MAANIALTGLAANDPTPGNFIEVNFAVGEAAGSNAQRPILLIGNKTSAGDATVDTVVYGPTTDLPIQTEADVIARFGTGSELHRMWRRTSKVNKETAIYAIACTEASGTAATLVITFATTAAAAGNVRLFVGDESVDVAIASGDTVTTIAAAVKAAVNAKTHWPVTADNSAGVLTLTAKNLGPRGNFLRGNALIFGTGVATTSNVTAVTAFTSGATEDSYTTVLTTVLARYWYYIASASNNTTQLTALVTQLNLQALPTNGIRQRVFAGHTGTANAAVTLATGASMNAARAELVACKNADWTPAEIAANAAGVYALEELATPPRNNFSGYGNSEKSRATWLVPAPRDGSAFTKTEIKTLLNNGVTPIGVNTNGTTYLSKRITSRSLTSSLPDYRIRDSHRVTQCDFFADDLVAKLALQYEGKDLGDDLAAGQRPESPNLVTPSMIRSAVLSVIDAYAANGRVKNVATIKANTIVQRSALNTNRVEIRVPIQIIDILDSTATAVDQVA